MTDAPPVPDQENRQAGGGGGEQDRDRRRLEPSQAIALAYGAGEEAQRCTEREQAPEIGVDERPPHIRFAATADPSADQRQAAERGGRPEGEGPAETLDAPGPDDAADLHRRRRGGQEERDGHGYTGRGPALQHDDDALQN